MWNSFVGHGRSLHQDDFNVQVRKTREGNQENISFSGLLFYNFFNPPIRIKNLSTLHYYLSHLSKKKVQPYHTHFVSTTTKIHHLPRSKEVKTPFCP